MVGMFYFCPEGAEFNSPGLLSRASVDVVNNYAALKGLCINPRHSAHRIPFQIPLEKSCTHPEMSFSGDVPVDSVCMSKPYRSQIFRLKRRHISVLPVEFLQDTTFGFDLY
jgi:hypothetical protein